MHLLTRAAALGAVLLGVALAAPAAPADAATTQIVTIISGDRQSVVRTGSVVPGGTATFKPLEVLVTDLAKRPAAGVPVTFACAAPPAMACQLTTTGGQSVVVTSDSQGHAILDQLGGNAASTAYAGGTFAIDVTGATFAPVTFTLTTTTATPAPVPLVNNPKLSIIGSPTQAQVRVGTQPAGGSASFAPLSVLLLDGSGKPVPNVPVTFTCRAPAQMACQLEPSDASHGTLNVTTNAAGVAVLDQMGGKALSSYYADGSFTVTASFASASVTFNLAVVGKPASTPSPNVVAIVSGNNQSAARTGSTVPGGVATFAPLEVLVSDTAGKPVSDARVDWVCAGASAAQECQLTTAGASSASSTTDAAGHAILNQMGGKSACTYYANGPATVTASGPTTTSVFFTLTTTAEVAPTAPRVITSAAFTVDGGNNQNVARTGTAVPGGIASFAAISVKLATNTGAPLANVPITFVCHVPHAWACQFDPSGADHGTYTVNTDANGIATMNRIGGNAMSVYYGSGGFFVTAAYGTRTITFSETVAK